MVVHSPSDMSDILRKCDIDALHEPLKHWAALALVRASAVRSQREERF